MTQLSIDQLVTRVLDLADRSAPAIRVSNSFDRSFDDHLAAARPAETQDRPIDQPRSDRPNEKTRNHETSKRPSDPQPHHETQSPRENSLKVEDQVDTTDTAAPASPSETLDEDVPVDTETAVEEAVQKIVTDTENEDSFAESLPSVIVTIAIDNAVEVAEHGQVSDQAPHTETAVKTDNAAPATDAANRSAETIDTLPSPAEGRTQESQTTRAADQPADESIQIVESEVRIHASSVVEAEQPTRATKISLPKAPVSEARDPALQVETEAARITSQIAEVSTTKKARIHNTAESKSETSAAGTRGVSNEHSAAEKSVRTNSWAKQPFEAIADEKLINPKRPPSQNIEAEPKVDQALPRDKPIPKRIPPTVNATEVRQAATSLDSPSRVPLAPTVDSTTLASDAGRQEVRIEAPLQPQVLNATPISTTPGQIALPHRTHAKSTAKEGQPITEAQRGRFLQRVTGALETARRSDGEVRIRLHPPELGALRMQIKVEDGALIARLETETQNARQILLENLPVLRERLASQEIRIERFEVDVKDQSTSNREQQAASDENRAKYERPPQDGPREHERTDVADVDKKLIARLDVSDTRLNVVI